MKIKMPFRHLLLFLPIIGGMLLFGYSPAVTAAQPPNYTHFSYLPQLQRTVPTTGNIVVTDIFLDGEGRTEPDEYVEIKNEETFAIDVQNWTLSDEQNHIFTFPAFIMQPATVCRVYTNQINSNYCGFSYNSGSAIWNNTGDCAYLRDSTNTLKSKKCKVP